MSTLKIELDDEALRLVKEAAQTTNQSLEQWLGECVREAAVLGVYLHSAAGRLVADDLGDAGALASDLLPRLPLAIKGLRAKR